MYNFKKDLEFGIEMELRMIDHLSKEGDIVEHWRGYNPDFDYSINGKTYEQKSDRQTRYTGNMCIEICKVSGEPTGITRTKADFWVYYPLGMKQVAVVPIEEMKRITREKYIKKIICGDFGGVHCLLVPWSALPDEYKIDYDPPCLL